MLIIKLSVKQVILYVNAMCLVQCVKFIDILRLQVQWFFFFCVSIATFCLKGVRKDPNGKPDGCIESHLANPSKTPPILSAEPSQNSLRSYPIKTVLIDS